jgi:Pyridoxamine 5'-phosphate oxidase
MATWAEFEEAAPDVAAPARDLLERFRFVLAGTIRRDGTPRISPVEAHLVHGQLVLVMIARTLKAHDVLRDPRIVLNSPVTDAADPGAELKLRGRALRVEDASFCEAAADTIEAVSGWRPRPDWHVFAVDLDDVAYMLWRDGDLEMDRWTEERGLEHVTRSITAGETL